MNIWVDSRKDIGEVGSYCICRMLFHFSPLKFFMLQRMQIHQLISEGFVIPIAK